MSLQRVRRRAFIAGLSSAAAWPLMARGQTGKIHRIGYLGEGDPSSPFVEAFRETLRELGYREGQNISIEWRYSSRKTGEELNAFANELVGLKLEAIVTTGGPATRAMKQATSAIPIVMAFSGDPVGTGLIESLSRPGKNLTGLSFMSPDLSAKRLEVLVEAFPKIKRIATLWNPDDPVYALELQRTETAAQAFGVTLRPMQVRTRDDFAPAFAAMGQDNADAIIVFAHALTIGNRGSVIELANRQRLPAMYGIREFVDEGGLIAYGPSLTATYKRAAFFVDKILKGTKPADLPVEQPTKFELVINMKTAKTIGLDLPPPLLARADEVIE
jgi:putative tryptophan/tyrosine transport system substrate-binding protein